MFLLVLILFIVSYFMYIFCVFRDFSRVFDSCLYDFEWSQFVPIQNCNITKLACIRLFCALVFFVRAMLPNVLHRRCTYSEIPFYIIVKKIIFSKSNLFLKPVNIR